MKHNEIASPDWTEIMTAVVQRHGYERVCPEALEEIHAISTNEGWNTVASGTPYPAWKVRSAYHQLVVEMGQMFAPVEV